jgi:hypothetical protein
VNADADLDDVVAPSSPPSGVSVGAFTGVGHRTVTAMLDGEIDNPAHGTSSSGPRA